MSVISALFKNYSEDGGIDFVSDGVIEIESWGGLDQSFQSIYDIFDFNEQTELEFNAKFSITNLINDTEIVNDFHYGYHGIDDDIPAIFVEN